MKILLAITCLALAVAAGAAGALLVSTPAPPTQIAIERNPPAAAIVEPARLQPAPLEDADLLARVESLTGQVEALRSELAQFREGTGRAAIEPPVVAAAPSEFAKAHRDGILQVIEEDRQVREQKREEERTQRENEALLARAERMAKQFGLSAMQQKSLADVLVLERQKIDDLRNQVREQGGVDGNTDVVRENIRTLREWRTGELTARFGDELAQKMNEFEMDRWRQGRRGRGAGAASAEGDGGAPR